MLVLPTLAARPLRPPPRLAPPPLASSWNCRTKRTLLQPGPFAAGADTPRGRGGPLPEPEQRDQLLLAALHAARLRDEESRRPDPLFIDPYAAVLLSLDVAHHASEPLALHLTPCADHYRLTTRYVDDKLQNLITSSDNFRQIVLLTDGMDTRPYRLSWPKLSVVYDVSPGRVFSAAAQQLRGAGAKIPRNCVLLHTPLESPNLQEGLCKNGFNGNRPSLWVLQGLPLFTSSSLESLLLVISSLAMKGSIFIGELTHFPDWTAAADMVSEKDRLENLFFTQGFQVSFVHYENVAKDLGLGYENVAKDLGLGLAPPRKQCGRVLLVAEQLRFSDAQMESFRSHFERTEEDADEEGFEEL
ncbi:O-methyltransferase 1, chloroplastic-like isoform X1 [Lolium rigidum]|uniref:O-methyltransferase 1, chloroplastic-like isoform X1 n=1 Tax=Lolium rigidum TaxID=89674 RepID=UPI001F5CD744|nr:O-methyltransferase 1, chloroplastic-like isoform X1 [Lolium rigidum]XP_047078493.1 O-methyltransferase 1, chloroplastic-like isoform X1 [Lolium rigidum]